MASGPRAAPIPTPLRICAAAARESGARTKNRRDLAASQRAARPYANRRSQRASLYVALPVSAARRRNRRARRGEIIEYRALGPLVAVTVHGKVLERRLHRLQLADLALERRDVLERDTLHLAAPTALIAPMPQALRDL